MSELHGIVTYILMHVRCAWNSHVYINACQKYMESVILIPKDRANSGNCSREKKKDDDNGQED